MPAPKRDVSPRKKGGPISRRRGISNMPRRDGLLGTYAALIGVLLASALVSLGRVETTPSSPKAAAVAAAADVPAVSNQVSKPPVSDSAPKPSAAGPRLVAPIEA